MRRKRTRQTVLGSPYVVLADVTTSMCFIFGVYAVWMVSQSSKAVLFMNRQDRQSQVLEKLIGALKQHYPNLVRQEYPIPGSTTCDYFLYPNEESRKTGQNRIANIHVNASFQRLSLLPKLFATNQTDPSKGAVRVYTSIGDVVRPLSPDISYVFLNGIAGTKEGRDKSDQERISRARAWSILDLWIRQGVVSDRPAGIPNRDHLGLEKVVCFGTGAKLYSSSAYEGRVDIVIFYQDVAD